MCDYQSNLYTYILMCSGQTSFWINQNSRQPISSPLCYLYESLEVPKNMFASVWNTCMKKYVIGNWVYWIALKDDISRKGHNIETPRSWEHVRGSQIDMWEQLLYLFVYLFLCDYLTQLNKHYIRLHGQSDVFVIFMTLVLY